MLDELKDIDRELDCLKRRVRRLINHLEKRHVRLMQLSDEDLLSEVGSRTLPATDIEKLLATAEGPRKKARQELIVPVPIPVRVPRLGYRARREDSSEDDRLRRPVRRLAHNRSLFPPDAGRRVRGLLHHRQEHDLGRSNRETFLRPL